jgi:hypothetical protein
MCEKRKGRSLRTRESAAMARWQKRGAVTRDVSIKGISIKGASVTGVSVNDRGSDALTPTSPNVQFSRRDRDHSPKAVSASRYCLRTSLNELVA